MLTLYHGSNLVFDRPDLNAARSYRDFGLGFYTTTLRSQAEDWARTVSKRFGGEPHLYTFTFEVTPELVVKEFPGICVEWLDMVKTNRLSGGVQHGFDVVIGPVANDNTIRTVSLYVAGVYSAEEAMMRLRYFQANDQLSIHTRRALQHLTLKGRENV